MAKAGYTSYAEGGSAERELGERLVPSTSRKLRYGMRYGGVDPLLIADRRAADGYTDINRPLSMIPAKLEPSSITPTLRQRTARAFLGDNPTSAARQILNLAIGQDEGVGEPGLSLIDLSPVNPFDVEEGYRDSGLVGAFLGLGAAKAKKGWKPAKRLARPLLGYAGGGVVNKAAKILAKTFGDDIAAPAVKKADAPLFDYSRLREVPDVPQHDLPRWVPPRGVSERVGDLLDDRKTIRKLESVIDRGLVGNGPAWYNNEPLREEFIAEFGREAGEANFRRYMDYVAGASPRSDIGTNVRNASFYYGLDKRGEPLPDINPKPYGHMAQKTHRSNAEQIRADDGWDVMANPKPASFVENLVGNQSPGTMDAHALKLPAMLSGDPRFLATDYRVKNKKTGEFTTFKPRQMFESGELSMKEALQRPAFFDAQPNANEYGALEGLYRDIGRKKGATTAQTQASGWIAGGDITDLGSPGDPFLKVFEDRVRLTADKTGKTPQEVLRGFMRGNVDLLKKGGRVGYASSRC